MFSIIIDKKSYKEQELYFKVQSIAKSTIDYVKEIIKPGLSLVELRKMCENKMLELGADSFWYYNVGAFIFAGDETAKSVSGKEYITSNYIIKNDDIITIDLSPQIKNIWGDYARTIIIENGKYKITSGKLAYWQRKSYIMNCLISPQAILHLKNYIIIWMILSKNADI